MKKIKEIQAKATRNINTKISIKQIFLLIFFAFLMILGIHSIKNTISSGLGIWGISNQVSWGWAIVNFVFWIGVAHAGTLISAILLVFQQNWRSEISRIAETMTIISIICAAIFPLIHTGRPWLAWIWMLPYPNQMGLWPNFISPLVWDYFAIGSYFIVSILFWYIGLIPDFAVSARIIKNNLLAKIHRFFSSGFVGYDWQWNNHKSAYGIIAGLATALVISVHSIVSLDFAVTDVAGWHSTLFPPYFVVGAIYSGLAAVVILLNFYSKSGLHKQLHFNKLGKLMLAASILLAYFYSVEIYHSFHSDISSISIFSDRISGYFSLQFWMMIFFNIILPQLLWFNKIRCNSLYIGIISIGILLGMWLERYLIVISSLSVSASGLSGFYLPTLPEIIIFIGSIGFFGLFFMIVMKLIPFAPAYEILEGEDE